MKKDKLRPENGGSESHLDDEKTEQLIEQLSEHTYAHTHQIVTSIFEHWGIKYTVSGLNKWLHQKGFTYKKPKGIPHKFDTEKQAEFIAHYKVLTASLPDGELLLFMDAVHPTQDTKITYGWIPKGVDKMINTRQLMAIQSLNFSEKLRTTIPLKRLFIWSLIEQAITVRKWWLMKRRD